MCGGDGVCVCMERCVCVGMRGCGCVGVPEWVWVCRCA